MGKSNNDKYELSIIDNNYIKDKKLVEIKNPLVVQKIIELTPKLLKMVNNAKKGNKEIICKVIIPKGESLAKSRKVKGAFRGFFRGKRGIKGQANLIDISKRQNVKDIYNLTTGIATQLVVQICINDISNKMTVIDEKCNYLISFEESKIEGKIKAILLDINRVIETQEEILNNDILRNNEINNLSHTRKECIETLCTINSLIDKKYSNNVNKYEEFKNVAIEINVLFCYQEVLIYELYELSNLIYLLNLGAASKNNCFSQYDICNKDTNSTNKRFLEWLENNEKKFGLNLDLNVRKRDGVLGKITNVAQKITTKEINAVKLDNELVSAIEKEKNICCNENRVNKIELFDKDLEVIFDDGICYVVEDE